MNTSGCVRGLGGFGTITLQRDCCLAGFALMAEKLHAQTDSFVAIKEMKKQLVVERNMQRAIGSRNSNI